MLLPVWLTPQEASPETGWSVRGVAPGVDRPDLEEIMVWLPSPAAFHAAGSGQVELVFHPLPSGAFHVARAIPARGQESGYIHGFVVSPDTFVRCGSNPFTVLRQAHAAGGWTDDGQSPLLAPIPLAAHPAPVDQILLARLAQDPGPARLATLLQAALDSVCLAIRAEPHATHLIAGLLNCLPPECRGEFSFSTLPVLSPQRPYRLVGGACWPEAPAALSLRYNIEAIDLVGTAEPIWRPLEAWPRLIQRCLASGYTAFLLRQFHVLRPELQWSDLSALGLQLLEEFDARVVSEEDETLAGHEHRPDRVLRLRHAHARFDASVSCPVKRPPAPSKNLDPDSPAVLERLESLDDVVFEAMGGNRQALDRLEKLWPQVRADLGEELLEESREQYLRYALALWDEYASSGGLRTPNRVDAAIEVLCVLLSSPPAHAE